LIATGTDDFLLFSMSTINQLCKSYYRLKKVKKNRFKALMSCPQRKGVCLKVFETTPRKPNSARRKVARVRLTNSHKITVSIPGEGHNLQNHSIVLVRAGRIKDLPGVRYRVIRGKFDALPVIYRKNARSKYGVKIKK
jgi:small subunit ribosomal protein S12